MDQLDGELGGIYSEEHERHKRSHGCELRRSLEEHHDKVYHKTKKVVRTHERESDKDNTEAVSPTGSCEKGG